MSTASSFSSAGESFEVVSTRHSSTGIPADYGFQRTHSPVESVGSDSSTSHGGSFSGDEDDTRVSDTLEDPFDDPTSQFGSPLMSKRALEEPTETESDTSSPPVRYPMLLHLGCLVNRMAHLVEGISPVGYRTPRSLKDKGRLVVGYNRSFCSGKKCRYQTLWWRSRIVEKGTAPFLHSSYFYQP